MGDGMSDSDYRREDRHKFQKDKEAKARRVLNMCSRIAALEQEIKQHDDQVKDKRVELEKLMRELENCI